MSDSSRLTGMVKWFNNKAGYGFITVCGEDRDIFVHYSNVKLENSPYTYLTQGEYVEFDLAETDNEQHKHQAVNITGIRGGPIMCETRRLARQNAVASNMEQPVVRVPKPPRAPRSADVPKPDFGDDKGFTTVQKKRAGRVTKS